MNKPVLIIALIVSVLNIILNINISNTAKQHTFWASAFISKEFLISLLIGSASVSTLLYLYTLNASVGKAMILMGAASIIGGVCYGIIRQNYSPATFEVILLVLILLVYTSRLFK